MPSGKTHDAVTFLLAAPVAAIAYVATTDVLFTVIATAAFLFGGLMFGPDLDTISRQYSRWSIFRFLWVPYRSFFKHRSRWSHGLVFGTLIRVVYFVGIVTLFLFAAFYARSLATDADLPQIFSFVSEWKTVGGFVNSSMSGEIISATFAGMWVGAASHTFTDMAGTFIKTGRITEFL